MNIDFSEVGRRIRTARQHKGMTAEQLSEIVGLASESLRHIENASIYPSLQTLYRIAQSLHVSMDYLTGRTPSFSDALSKDYGITAAQEETLREIIEKILPIITKRV